MCDTAWSWEDESPPSPIRYLSESEFNFKQHDLGDQLMLEVRYNDDIRRCLIPNEDITFDELMLMLQKLYCGQIQEDGEIMVKYENEDGDMLTMVNSFDLKMAIHYSRVLKLEIFLQTKTENTADFEFRRELLQICNATDRAMKSFLETIDAHASIDFKNAEEIQEAPIPDPMLSENKDT